MTCQELNEFFELYTLGALEIEERAEIDAHLARGCETCAAALSNALVVNAGILSLAGDRPPPRHLKRRVLNAIGARDQNWSWGWVWACGGAVALAVAVWLGVQERQRTAELAEARQTMSQVSAERDRLTAALQFLSDPQTVPASFGKGQTAPPRGYVFLHPQMGVLLIASNLPPAGAGKTYEMWVIPKGGAPRPAGLFQSEGTRAVHILNGPLDPATIGTVAVTIEPAAGSAAPTMPIIIAAPVGT